jgi:PAS domain S-box-containing protein
MFEFDLFISILIVGVYAILKYRGLRQTHKKVTEELCNILNTSANMIFLTKQSSDFIHSHFSAVNESACTQLGYSKSELLEISLFDIIHPSYHFHFENMLNSQSSGNIGFQNGVKYNTSKYTGYEFRYGNAKKAEPVSLMVRFSFPIYNLDNILPLDQEGLFTSINPTGEKITGYSREEILHSSLVV